MRFYNPFRDEAAQEFGEFVKAYTAAVQRGAIRPLLSRDVEALGRVFLAGFAEGLAAGTDDGEVTR